MVEEPQDDVVVHFRPIGISEAVGMPMPNMILHMVASVEEVDGAMPLGEVEGVEVQLELDESPEVHRGEHHWWPRHGAGQQRRGGTRCRRAVPSSKLSTKVVACLGGRTGGGNDSGGGAGGRHGRGGTGTWL